MRRIKYSIKFLLASILFYSGFLRLYKILFFKNKAIILMYHRILGNSEHNHSYSHDGIIVNTNSFKKQIKFLSQNFNILTIDNFSTHIKENKPFDGTSCLITFDDGWHDNYKNAFPILKLYNTAAHIFLPVHFISNTDNFWQEKLNRYMSHICHNPNLFSDFINNHHLQEFILLEKTEIKISIRNYISKLKACSPEEIKHLLEQYETEMVAKNCMAPANEIDTYLNWPLIRKMQEDSISFGSHAISHHMLTKLDKHQLEHELYESRRIIESQIGKTVNSIAYPNGNHDKIVCSASKQAGYELGFTTKHGYATASTDPLRIPRINIHEDMTKYIPLFYCRILGIF